MSDAIRYDNEVMEGDVMNGDAWCDTYYHEEKAGYLWTRYRWIFDLIDVFLSFPLQREQVRALCAKNDGCVSYEIFPNTWMLYYDSSKDSDSRRIEAIAAQLVTIKDYASHDIRLYKGLDRITNCGKPTL